MLEREVPSTNHDRVRSLSTLGNLLSFWFADRPHGCAPVSSIGSLPAHYARVIRHRRNRSMSSAHQELKSALQALTYTDERWENLRESTGDIPVFSDTVLELLRTNCGPTIPEAFSSLRHSLTSVSTCSLLDASELPYARELDSLFPLFGSLVSTRLAWDRSSPDGDRPPVSEEIVQRTLLTDAEGRPQYDSELFAGMVGSHYELRATVVTAEELGLAAENAPPEGWLDWCAPAVAALSNALRDQQATGRRLVAAAENPSRRAQAIDDPRYGNATLLVSAFEGRPLNDTAEWRTSDVIWRFKRAIDHPRFPHELAPVISHLDLLITDLEEDPWLWDEILGGVDVSPGIEPLDALADLRAQLMDPHPRPPRPTLKELPLSGWELRFRFPGLAAFGEGRPDVSGRKLVEDVAAAHEPCRIGLPPLIGEIAELVALLPDEEDVDRAMAHLGATGTGWRPILEGMVTNLTAHVWAHDEERRG
ncbi:hypothetical protein [Actinomadura gamaensis]|uniref:Uncharacterized protein n=1 Tax=Actinomadura gamaensis TaxID=1763541 RepID=A0ABV9U816_9ACTN